MNYWIRELKRLTVPILALVALLILSGFLNGTSRLALLSYKIVVISIAVILAHAIRSEIFPYLDLKNALTSGDRGYAIGSAIVVGAVFASIVLGLTLGL